MNFVLFVINAVQMIVIVDAISSWFAKPNQFPRSITDPLTTPLYAPIRKLMGTTATGGIDWAPLIVIVGLNVVAGLLTKSG